jgi:hypothetical protein
VLDPKNIINYGTTSQRNPKRKETKKKVKLQKNKQRTPTKTRRNGT